VMVLHSDGLVDARNREGSRFRIERVLQTLSDAPGIASLASEALLESVTLHSQGVALFDNLTVVCVGRDST
jgi:serine phosphatase RsbU (regulator of sigma subunit)